MVSVLTVFQIKAGASAVGENLSITLLVFASMCGLLCLCDKLLNESELSLVLDQRDGYYKRTPLNWASHNGHLEVARLLLDRSEDYHRSSPLYTAVRKRDVEMVRLLLDRGALTVDERRPLQTVYERRQRQTILFTAYGSRVNERLLERGVEIFSMLLEKGAEVNSRSMGDGCTPLHIAADTGQVEIMTILLERGANFEVKDDQRRSPLCIAVERSNVEAVRVLLEKGANPNAAAKAGWSLLHSAVFSGNIKIVRLLIEKGADVEQRKLLDDLRRLLGDEELKLCLESRANLEVRDTSGSATPDRMDLTS